MNGIESRVRQTVQDFAESMEIRTLPESGRDGSYKFVFEKLGILTLQPSADGRIVLVALGRTPYSNDTALMERFFQHAGIDPVNNRPIHAGLSPDGSFQYVTSIPVDRFDLPAIEETLNQLTSIHDGL